MKKEDLIALGIAEDVAEKVFALHGKGLEPFKVQVTNLQTQLKTATDQLAEANTAIEGFKKLNPEQLQKAADEWKTKFETAQTDAKNQLAALKFDHALESALTGAKVKNIKTVLPLLSRDKLILQDDGTISGLDDQLKVIREKDAYLFADEKEPPKIVAGGNNQPVITDAFEAAMWKGAGIKPPEAKQ